MRLAGCFIAAFALLVNADTNYTVDDFQRDRISYQPNSAWRAVSDGATQDRYMRTTSYTNTQGAYAVFKFKGSAIYYGGYGELVTGADKPGTIRVKLDNATVDVSANIDPQHPAQQILFVKKGLDPNIEHTITLQKTSESGKRDLNIDFFTYTVPEGQNDTQIIIPFVPPANNQDGAPLGVILGGIFGGVIGGMLLVIFTLWYINKRKGRQERRVSSKLEATDHGDSHPLMASPWVDQTQNPSHYPAGYGSPPRAPTPSSYSMHSSAPSSHVPVATAQYAMAHGHGPSDPSASTLTGEPWLSPNATPRTGTFSPGITSASSSAPLPHGDPPPPLYAESTGDAARYNRR